MALLALSLFVSFFISTPSVGAISQEECEARGGNWSDRTSRTRPRNCILNVANYTPADQLRSYAYYNALSRCGSIGGWQERVLVEDANTPSKWGAGQGISVGYLVDPSDGLMSCSEMMEGALNLWGYTTNEDYLEALRDFGFRLERSGCTSGTRVVIRIDCYTRPDNIREIFQTAIKNRIYDNTNPTLEGNVGLLYLRGLYHIEFENTCAASPFKRVSDLTSEERELYSSTASNFLRIKVVNSSNWLAEEWIYTIERDRYNDLIKLNEQPTGGSVEYTCSQLASQQVGYADRLASAAQAAVINGNVDELFGDIVGIPGSITENTGGAPSRTGGDSTQSTCTVTGIGWIVCPVITFTAGIVDAAYGFVAGLLTVQPFLTTGETAGAYEAWQVMRNLANIAFVIVFLILIFSQLTSLGVSNYGVKKLLPRLVIAAILVNISYWVSALAVDLSNVIGASTVTVFEGVGTSIPATELESITDTGAGWLGIAGGILATAGAVGAAYYVGLSALIPALLAALVAIVTVFLVLTLRQALIILLVVISPLAFVAFLLPNTENLFNRWRKLFTTLLLMYPIIAALFGAAALASSIIMNSSDDTVIQIMGALIAILPLALTPLVLKSAGGLLGQAAAIIRNAQKAPVSKLRDAGDRLRKDRQNIRNMRALNGAGQLGRGMFVRRSARRNAITAGREGELKRASGEYLTGQTLDNEKFRNAVAGGTIFTDATVAADQRALSSAISTQDKLELMKSTLLEW